MFDENEISIKANGGTELAKRHLGQLLPQDLQDNFQIICSRVRDLQEDKIRIFWCHDLFADPECKKLAEQSFRQKFHKIVYVSNWQYDMFRKGLNLPYTEKDIVIENGIEPMQYIPNKSNDVINLVYASTPQRGLGILVPVFEALYNHRKDIHLHVFSSFKIYGWDDADKQFNELFERCKAHPAITYHGYQDYATVRQQVSQSHILAYPSIWEETSCRVLIEAMSAGLLCVHPNYGALPDTSGGLTIMYQGDEDLNLHAQIFANTLNQAIDKAKNIDMENYSNLLKHYTDMRFGINKISKQWEFLLNDLLDQYSTIESRKLNKTILTFKF
jgi:glycosyltransferase involved in cell wall biosynthesis